MSFWRQFVNQPQRVWLRKAFFQVHLWAGMILGLYVLIVSLTGSAIVFRQEIYRDYGAKPVFSAAVGERLSSDKLMEFVAKAYPGYDASVSYENAKNPKQAVEITVERGSSRKVRLFDPYTGENVGSAVPVAISLVSWLADLHISLLNGQPGRVANAVGGGLFALIGLTGIIVWWPGIQKWKRSLTINFKGNWKRVNWDLHSAFGFWTLFFVVMWGVTGIFASTPDPFRAAVDYLQPIQPVVRTPRPPGQAAGANAAGENNVQPGQRGQGGQGGGQRGRVPRVRPPQRLGDKILADAYALHFGNFGGWPVKVLWMILGLAPPLLFVTGTLMWWNRVIRKREF